MNTHHDFPFPPAPRLHTNTDPAIRLDLLENDAPGDPRRIGLDLQGDRDRTGTMVLEASELDALVALLHDLLK